MVKVVDVTPGEDDDFGAEATPPEASVAETSRKGAGKGRGKGKRAGAILTCIVPECGCVRAANSKFCRPHHASWNALELPNDDDDEEAQQILAELKQRGNDQERGMAVFNFCLINPSDAKYVKRRFFDLLQYHKSRFVTTQKVEKSVKNR